MVIEKISLKQHKRNVYYELQGLLNLLSTLLESGEFYQLQRLIMEIDRLRIYRIELDNIKEMEIELTVKILPSKINPQI